MIVLAQTTSVSIRFGELTAVESVTLEVGAGEVVGLLGANGAGKTTLIRLLLGLLQSSSGEVRLLGRAPGMTTRRQVGYVPQSLGLYSDLTVKENWAFTAAVFGMGKEPSVPADVVRWSDELVGLLPLGAQRRVAFAVALAHRPALLVLDEPTSGVGPLGRAQLWRSIRTAAENGAGVLVTTHNMEEAEQCDRLVIMADGRVVAEGALGDLTAGHRVLEVSCPDWEAAFRAIDAAGLAVQSHGEVLRVTAPRSAVTAALRLSGIHAEIRPVAASLEETFVELVVRRRAS